MEENIEVLETEEVTEPVVEETEEVLEEKEGTEEVCPDCGRVDCTCEPGTCECTEEENCGCYDAGIGTLTEDLEQDVVDQDDDFYKACVADENIEILDVEENNEAE